MGHYIQDKVVVITGGSSGFGLEAARMLVKMGGKVVITGRNVQRLQEAAKEIGSEELLPVQADAVQTEDWHVVIEKTLDRFGRIDVLVNNHGAGVRIAEVETLTDEDIHEIININLIGVIKGCRAVIPIMKRQGSGHIVNVSSGCAYRGWAGWGPYTAAKAGMVGFTRVLHREMCGWGGKATSFIPGAAKTHFCDAAQIDDSWLDDYPDAYEFARTLVHCIDVPANSVIEEVRIWGTQQVKDMLNPY